MEWLKRHFPDHRIHSVNFPGDPYPIHIDATFVPLRPGLIINNPNRPLPDEQRRIFNKNDWEIVDAAAPVHNTPPPLCYSSVWLSMNCLVLDHKTVIVEASETKQMEQMDKLGMEVLPRRQLRRLLSCASWRYIGLVVDGESSKRGDQSSLLTI